MVLPAVGHVRLCSLKDVLGEILVRRELDLLAAWTEVSRAIGSGRRRSSNCHMPRAIDGLLLRALMLGRENEKAALEFSIRHIASHSLRLSSTLAQGPLELSQGSFPSS